MRARLENLQSPLADTGAPAEFQTEIRENGMEASRSGN